jgi:hypothetical protein
MATRRLRFRRFVVGSGGSRPRWTEEGDCETCGYPLEVGDVAVLDGAERMYCSARCAVAGEERAEDRPSVH